MRKLFLLFSAAITIASTLQAQNPVIRDQFTADPTARVFNGKVYIYPSHDIPSPIDRLNIIGKTKCERYKKRNAIIRV